MARSLRAVAKQRAALQDFRRPAAEIRKPYRMRTREFKRRMAILARHEARLREVRWQLPRNGTRKP
jgi:hypothetical protein